MASAEEIAEVAEMLGPHAPQDGWDDVRIGEELDEGQTPDEIAQTYWEVRMAKTSGVVNVTESGSSRSLSDIHKHAKEMAAYYHKKNSTEVNQARSGLRTHKLRRV